MLIRSAPRAEVDELGGNDAWRSEYRGARYEGRAGCGRSKNCKLDVYRHENLPDIREAVEPATGADPVTVIRLGWVTVIEAGLMHWRNREGDSIAQIAMRRIRCKPEQQSAE
jgi:hypothetical protein